RSKWLHAFTMSGSAFEPGPFDSTRCGADSTQPSRTIPGKPTEMRSYFSMGLMSCCSVSTNRVGDSGYGVGTRNRSVSIFPVASSADAFSPLPPMSIARVIGPVFASVLAALVLLAVVMTGRLCLRPDRVYAASERELCGDRDAGHHSKRDGRQRWERSWSRTTSAWTV